MRGIRRCVEVKNVDKTRVHNAICSWPMGRPLQRALRLTVVYLREHLSKRARTRFYSRSRGLLPQRVFHLLGRRRQVFHWQEQIEVRLGSLNNPTRDALLNSDLMTARSLELKRQELEWVVAKFVQG